METWKEISDYLHIYFVSDKGKVKKSSGKILQLKKDKYGYLRVRLTLYKKYRKSVLVHRLVALHFIGHKDFNKMTVNHKDGNKENNNVDNLEILTFGDNNRHAYKTGLKNNKGTNHGKARFTEQDILDMRNLFSQGKKQTEIARLFLTTQPRVREIVLRETWSHI